MTTTYKLCKAVISAQKVKGTLNVEEMTIKLDTFLLAGRITDDEYTELIAFMAE